MTNITVAIEGKTPLILNRFTDEEALSATKRTRSTSAGHAGTPKEVCEKKLYRGTDGKLTIPQPNLFACIMDAGRFFKYNRTKITTQKTSQLTGCVEFTEVDYPLRSKEGWTVDTRPVRNPNTGMRILCHRPLFNDWRVKFEMELDEEIMPAELLRDIVDAAGKRIGLGDFRPACKGPYGKFLVTEWKVRRP